MKGRDPHAYELKIKHDYTMISYSYGMKKNQVIYILGLIHDLIVKFSELYWYLIFILVLWKFHELSVYNEHNSATGGFPCKRDCIRKRDSSVEIEPCKICSLQL